MPTAPDPAPPIARRLRRRAALAALLLAAVAACTGPTEPAEPLEVTISVIEAPTSVIEQAADGMLNIRCSVRVEVMASGAGSAEWTRVGLRRYATEDRQTPSDSSIRAYGIEPIFSRDAISRARPDSATLSWFSYEPAGLDFVFWYLPRGATQERSITHHLECGPALPPGAVPPTVEILEVRGSDPVLEFGDTLIVRYRATSGGALYSSRMNITGAFGVERRIPEGFELLREREERFVVPRTAHLDTPITLRLAILDVGRRSATVAETTTVVVEDVRAPVLGELAVTPGQFMVGSAVQIIATASDERALSHIVWEFGAPVAARDSIATTDVTTIFQVPVMPAWAGKQATLTVFARDAGGNYSNDWTSAPGAFAFYPTGPLTGTTSGGLVSLDDVVYDRQRERLYAVNTYGATLTAFDIASMSQIATIALPPWPGAADITLSGDSLLVTQSASRSLSIIDLNSLALVDSVRLPPVDSLAVAEGENHPLPTGVRVMANGKAIVQLHREATGGTNSVELDLQTGVSRLRTETTGGGGGVMDWWSRMGVAPDRTWLVLLDSGCTRTYASATDSFSGCMNPDPGDLRALHFGFDGVASRVIAGGRVLSANLAPIANLPVGASQLLPDGQHALAVVGEGLVRIRVTDGLIISRVHLGGGPSRLILLDDGHTILMLGDGGVTKFDTALMP